MTAVAFPLSPAMQSRLTAREDAVTYSRAILRSAAPHDPQDVRLACHTLMTYGSQWDWVEAYHVLRAMDTPVDQPPYSHGPGTIRRALIGIALMLSVGWLALIGMMLQ
jgi:hypothetical protein